MNLLKIGSTIIGTYFGSICLNEYLTFNKNNSVISKLNFLDTHIKSNISSIFIEGKEPKIKEINNSLYVSLLKNYNENITQLRLSIRDDFSENIDLNLFANKLKNDFKHICFQICKGDLDSTINKSLDKNFNELYTNYKNKKINKKQ